MTFPEPVIEVAIEPKTKADQDKLGIALQRLAEEDPTFRVQTDEETRPDAHRRHGRAAPRRPRRPDGPRVQGRGQRRQAAGRLPRDDPQAPPRATAASSARPAARASTATPSSGSSPREQGAGYEFVDKIVGGTIPREYIKPIDDGHPRGARDGHLRRLSRWSTSRSTLFDGSYHEVDSSRDGVQDRRLDGRQGRGRARPAR